MEQLSLFSNTPKTFYEKTQNVLDEVITSHDLPEKSIHLYSNISPKTGKETSKSICIFEPEYPPNPAQAETPGKNFVIMKIEEKKSGDIVLFIRYEQEEMIDTPTTATVKALKSDKTFLHITFDPDDSSIFEYIKKNILYCLANYESSNSFGCCSKFIECSDAKKCVHENKIYSMGCKYRMNLDAGKIFYGKNKNI